MLRRQFTVQKLLNQLQTGQAKRHFENNASAIEKSNIFSDMTNAVDSVITDAEVEAVAIANILVCVQPAQIGFAENTPIVTVSDYDDKIESWLTSVLQHACTELLTSDNEIKPAILNALPASITDGLTAENLVLSYFHALKNATEELVKQKLRHVNITNRHLYNDHVENVYFVFDSRTQQTIVSDILIQEFNKRNPTQNSANALSASALSASQYGYQKTAWARKWQASSHKRTGVGSPTPTTIKVTL